MYVLFDADELYVNSKSGVMSASSASIQMYSNDEVVKLYSELSLLPFASVEFTTK